MTYIFQVISKFKPQNLTVRIKQSCILDVTCVQNIWNKISSLIQNITDSEDSSRFPDSEIQPNTSREPPSSELESKHYQSA